MAQERRRAPSHEGPQGRYWSVTIFHIGITPAEKTRWEALGHRLADYPEEPHRQQFLDWDAPRLQRPE